ncbi:hypothetical protein CA13_25640 [Planctomycetes bacterium CA13]|uniref:Elp3/MiaA/NifB-like radical SAM core domain-containing protein n=1 Tax=Novipirellula herctigrandis TaxID=2527986 RepID=A0A5C5Z2E6_9BACT|nr:hypothetical protein CA13_25640 [Planctomycetes bacterium CA13]
MTDQFPQFTDSEIASLRGDRIDVSPKQPYAMLVEPERNASGEVIDVATIFLTNRECPFRCLMCDLWKNTLTETVAEGDIPGQIQFALDQLPAAREVKLYNSGSFFDRKAIPPEDYAEIATLVRGFDTVIVENHPKLCSDACETFRDLIAPAQLEIAIGLETCHPELLQTLNKGMQLSDFDSALRRLHDLDIRTRVFLLQSLPYLTKDEAIDWTLRSIDYALDRGVSCCSVIPTRSGNGMMETLVSQGKFSLPTSASLETVAELGLQRKSGRVFIDLWDCERFFLCDHCRSRRVERLRQMNLTQTVLEPIECPHC